MASSTALPDFTRLNDSVHYRKGIPEKSTSSPGFILFLSWGGAPLKLVDKYTKAYGRIYPQSSVLLVQTEFRHILTHRPTSQDRPLEPALSILHQHMQRQGTGSHKTGILVHLLSNGGAYKVMELAKRYKAQTGECLPMDALILDSAPGIPTLLRSFKALSYALPKLWLFRWPLQVVLLAFLMLQRTIEKIVVGEGLIRLSRRQMNDGALLDKKARRCYIYGPGDELVGLDDVKAHAADARASGYNVQEEVFEGTPHVAHMRGDPDRYWAIVKRTWDASQLNE